MLAISGGPYANLSSTFILGEATMQMGAGGVGQVVAVLLYTVSH